MNAQADASRAVNFFECHAHDSRQQQRIDLRFAVQNFAGNGERQLDHFALDSGEVCGPVAGELRQCSREAGAFAGQLFFENLAGLGLPFRAAFGVSLGFPGRGFVQAGIGAPGGKCAGDAVDQIPAGGARRDRGVRERLNFAQSLVVLGRAHGGRQLRRRTHRRSPGSAKSCLPLPACAPPPPLPVALCESHAISPDPAPPCPL